MTFIRQIRIVTDLQIHSIQQQNDVERQYHFPGDGLRTTLPHKEPFSAFPPSRRGRLVI